MKKIILSVILICIMALGGCSQPTDIGSVTSDSYIKKENINNVCSSGVWLSFSEINKMLKNPQEFKSLFEEFVANCTELKIENVYIHVRSYCDSLMKSDYFPLIDNVKDYDYDVFGYMVDKCHSAGIKVHAWINPYRVTTSSTDVESLNKDCYAYKWLHDENKENDINIIIYNGIYLNPAETEVQQLVINGVREILKNYNVEGIHLDDYFYPTTDVRFDNVSYEKYKESSSVPLSLEDWRRNNVNSLISGCYTAVKSFNKNILFTVSPMASIKKNYDELYADVKCWIDNGYVDYIIPQLYFGFEHNMEEFRFNNLLSEWEKLCKCNKNVGLLIGLGFYKTGINTEADGSEWQDKTDIISRQAEICMNDKNVEGYVIFSYTSLFSKEELNIKQRDNLLTVINKDKK